MDPKLKKSVSRSSIKAPSPAPSKDPNSPTGLPLQPISVVDNGNGNASANGNGNGAADAGMATPKGPVPIGRSLDITSTPDVCMELLIDKWKLLEYEKEFCKKRKPYRKPFSRAHFAVKVGQQNEQFFDFTSVAAWLLSLAGADIQTPKEFDDPNTTCTNILNACKRMGFATATFHPTKLSSGFGKEVCGVLDGITDYVIEKKGVTPKRPFYPAESYPDEVDMEEDSELTGADQFEQPIVDDLEEEEAYMEPARMAEATGSTVQETAEKQILTSKVDPTQWRLELERVAPKLRITVAAEAKDWRSHLDDAHGHQRDVSGVAPDSCAALERMRTDVNVSLEKLATREKFLNETFEHLLVQFRASRRRMGDSQEQYKTHTENVNDRNTEIERIADQMKDVTEALADRQNMSGETKIAGIQGAIKKLRDELKMMEVRLGVVSHTLLALNIRSKRSSVLQMQDE